MVWISENFWRSTNPCYDYLKYNLNMKSTNCITFVFLTITISTRPSHACYMLKQRRKKKNKGGALWTHILSKKAQEHSSWSFAPKWKCFLNFFKPKFIYWIGMFSDLLSSYWLLWWWWTLHEERWKARVWESGLGKDYYLSSCCYYFTWFTSPLHDTVT